MSYAKQNLLPEEKIIHFTKPHYIVFISMLFWLAVALWAITSSYAYGKLLFFAGIIFSIHALITYYCSEYVITNKRIIMKTGFIRRSATEIFLERLEGINVRQSIMGRILNYGTITVGGIGGTKNPFNYIPKPMKFRNMVLETQTQIKEKV